MSGIKRLQALCETHESNVSERRLNPVSGGLHPVQAKCVPKIIAYFGNLLLFYSLCSDAHPQPHYNSAETGSNLQATLL
jgi:hypothetical protein